MKHLHLIGTSHRFVPPSRIGEVGSKEELLQLLNREKDQGLLRGFVLLCTCNRREAYLELAPGSKEIPPSIVRAFSRVPGLRLQGPSVTEHLFRVASSLDSMVVGENQISGQVRAAVQDARDQRRLSSLLEEGFQAALRTAKEIRRKTGLGTQSVSVASVGAAATRTLLARRGIENPRIAIVGAGTMAKKAASAFRRGKACRLFFVNRSEHKARALAETYGGETLSLAQVLRGSQAFDALLTAVSTEKALIDLACAQILTREGPIVLTDLGSPANIEKRCGDLDGVSLLDMDKLREISEAKLEERQALAAQAEPILQRGLARFRNRQKAKDLGLDRVRREHLKLAEEELSRITQFGGFSESYKSHLEEAFLRLAKAHAHLHLKDLKTRLMPAQT